MLRRVISLMGVSLLLVGCGSASSANPPPSGSVTIATDQTTYQPNEAMIVTVRNTLSTPIYAMDTQSSCSILSLHYQVSGVWHPSQVAQCPQKRPARPVKIDAGATYTATITAGYPGLKTLDFPAGSYQFVLIYTTSSSVLPSAEHGTTITSATILVQ